MIERSLLLAEVVKVLRGPCGIDQEIGEASRLGEDLKLDSVGLLSLAINLENHYRVRLPDSSEQPPETVGDIVDLLQQTLPSDKEIR